MIAAVAMLIVSAAVTTVVVVAAAMSFRRRKPTARETQWPLAWARASSKVPTKDGDSSKLPVIISPVSIKDTESERASAVVLKGYKGVRPEGNI